MDTFYVSHGARLHDGTVKWFVVEPNPMGLEAEIERLRKAGRTVLSIVAEPYAEPPVVS